MDTKPDAELPEGFFDDPVADAKVHIDLLSVLILRLPMLGTLI